VKRRHILLHILPIRSLLNKIDGNGMDLLERRNMGGDETILFEEIQNARWDEESGMASLKWNEIENTTK
jgi:hypothetical protein